MRYCNLNVYITVEAATLIGLTFFAATSYLYHTAMARKRKTGAAKPADSTDSTSTASPAATASKGADAKGPAQGKPASGTKKADARPENSPYGSPSCTVPFASPLTVPLEILKKSPKLHAAYELRLPELPAIPEAVGHVLVHYLHTGTYESLKPKSTESLSRQVSELKTSIQVYAAARTYELPELMRLAQTRIERHGKGLPLPALLEVARDAYPDLTEGDAWFLNYLRSRIRPHLKDPKTLMGSSLLDQISGILSPNKVLLRTVLELFCERIVVRPETATPLAASTIGSPIASPGNSRPVSPQPPASSLSLLEMRSRSVVAEECTPSQKPQKATSLPSPDNMSEASKAEQGESEPQPGPEPEVKGAIEPEAETAEPKVEDAEQEVKSAEPQVKTAKLEDKSVEPEGKAAELEVNSVEPDVKVAASEVEIAEPEAEVAEREIKTAEPEIKATPGGEVSIAIEPEPKADLPNVVPVDALFKSAVEVTAELPVETKAPTTVEPEAVKPDDNSAQRERKDSGKEIDLEALPKELDSSPENVSELEPNPKPQPHIKPQVLREADSGFWEGPDAESGKERTPSVVGPEESAAESAAKVVHELASNAGLKDGPSMGIRDFSSPDATIEGQSDKREETETGTREEAAPDSQLAKEASSEAVANVQPKELESQLEPEPLPTKLTEAAPEQPANARDVVSEAAPAQKVPETADNKEVKAQPETEKAQKETVELQEVAKSEPEPQADSSEPVHLPDVAEPTGSPEAKTAQPDIEPEPKPSGKLEDQDASTDSAAYAPSTGSGAVESAVILGAKPASEHEGTKAEADGADNQPCSAQVRQRSWKKRFMSLRYPVLFNRNM
ncbi:hypothetical protein VTH06DRAFT_2803 [Thermothelomyces fergusii]